MHSKTCTFIHKATFTFRTAISDSDFHVQTNQKLWAQTPEDVKTDYGDTYFHAFVDKMLTNLRFSSRKTYMVIDDLYHAVTSTFPYTRYVPGRLIQCLSDMFFIQSNFLQDSFIKSKIAVHCTPFSMRKKKTV